MSEHAPAPAEAPERGQASVEYLSQWQLIRRRFVRHKLALAALYLLVVLYAVVVRALSRRRPR